MIFLYSSVLHELGGYRFDIIQDETNPTLFGFNEVYSDEAAFEYHTKTPHITKWRYTVKDWYTGEHTGRRRGRNVWPPDNWGWSSGKPAW